MSLMRYVEMVRQFEEKAGWSGEPLQKRVQLLQEEVDILKESLSDAAAIQHQLYDVLFLVCSIAASSGSDLDVEWEKGWGKKHSKYL